MVNHTQTMAMKGMLLHHINTFLEEDFDKIHQEVIQSVLHLIIMEVRNNRALKTGLELTRVTVVFLRLDQFVGSYERFDADGQTTRWHLNTSKFFTQATTCSVCSACFV